jgi:hypothetical protein
MKRLDYIKLIILACLTIQSACKSTHPVLYEKYPMSDTLVVRNYLFQQIDNFVFNSPQYVADSSILKFKTIISKLDIPLVFEDTLENKVDYFFLREEYIAGSTKKNVDTNLVLTYVNSSIEGEVILLPYIELHNRVISGTAFTHYSAVKIVIYIIKDNKITYAHRGIVHTKKYNTPNREDIKKNLNTIEDWEKAINEAMKEYIERLE